MAKTKKKAEKATKITNEELNSLQELINNINKHHLQIGQLITKTFYTTWTSWIK